jgi:Acetyltransferases
MQSVEIYYLEWDSKFFERKIGKVDMKDYSLAILPDLLENGKKYGYELLYVFVNEDVHIDSALLQKHNGKLVDRKIVYTKPISLLASTVNRVVNYEGADVSSELELLAISSGKYSRFKLDEKIGVSYFEGLYKLWAEKSVSGEIADKVFTISEDKKLAGFVTLKFNSVVGEIGLIAVNNDTQGRGYGRLLIDKCCNELSIRNISELVVPTQLHNLEACRFYEKCGFSKKSITNIYHFWL